MQSEITVRPARAADKDAILSFCVDTFSWGDYISEVWDAWLADDRGKIFVGVVNDKAIGMMHVAFLSDGAAWMEGMRVHPEYRRLGLASAMDAAGRAYAREHRGTLARLATARDNIAAQKTLERQGYQCTARYGAWTAKPTRGKLAHVATEKDLPTISARWRKVPCAIVANTDWHWEKIDNAALAELQRQNFLRVAEDSLAILPESTDGRTLTLYALAGSVNAMSALARSVRAEASYRGLSLVEAMTHDDSDTARALERAGFRDDGGMLIYEQAL